MNEQCDRLDGAAVVQAPTACLFQRVILCVQHVLHVMRSMGRATFSMRMVWGRLPLLVKTQLSDSIEHPCGRGNSTTSDA